MPMHILIHLVAAACDQLSDELSASADDANLRQLSIFNKVCTLISEALTYPDVVQRNLIGKRK